MTIIQYLNEHILTFFYKRYNFAHRSFLLYLDGGMIRARPLTLFTACTLIVFGCKVNNYKPIHQIILQKSCVKNFYAAILRRFSAAARRLFAPYKCPKIVYFICMRARAYTRV